MEQGLISVESTVDTLWFKPVSPSIGSVVPVFHNKLSHTGLEVFWLWSVVVILIAVFHSCPEISCALLLCQWDLEAARWVTYIVSVNSNRRTVLTKWVRFESVFMQGFVGIFLGDLRIMWEPGVSTGLSSVPAAWLGRFIFSNFWSSSFGLCQLEGQSLCTVT